MSVVRQRSTVAPLSGVRRPAAPRRSAPAALLRRRRRRRRRVVGLVRLAVVLLIVALVAWAGTRVAGAADGSQPLSGVEYVVRAGDTLWDVVAAHYGTQRHDVRALVDLVEAENGLSQAVLTPGQHLRLPYVPN